MLVDFYIDLPDPEVRENYYFAQVEYLSMYSLKTNPLPNIQKGYVRYRVSVDLPAKHFEPKIEGSIKSVTDKM